MKTKLNITFGIILIVIAGCIMLSNIPTYGPTLHDVKKVFWSSLLTNGIGMLLIVIGTIQVAKNCLN